MRPHAGRTSSIRSGSRSGRGPTRKTAGEPIDWRPLLAGYRAIVDWPGAYFWRELTSAHPEAKVILTVRDPERWYASTLATIFNFSSRVRDGDPPSTRVRQLLLRSGMPGMREGLRFIDDLVWQGTFDGRFREREYALRVFNEHNQAVQETIPTDKLLVFDVKQGWEPLCQFLGVPVPAGEPFPHLNDASSMRMRTWLRERTGVWRYGLARLRQASSWGCWRSPGRGAGPIAVGNGPRGASRLNALVMARTATSSVPTSEESVQSPSCEDGDSTKRTAGLH